MSGNLVTQKMSGSTIKYKQYLQHFSVTNYRSEQIEFVVEHYIHYSPFLKIFDSSPIVIKQICFICFVIIWKPLCHLFCKWKFKFHNFTLSSELGIHSVKLKFYLKISVHYKALSVTGNNIKFVAILILCSKNLINSKISPKLLGVY